MNRSLQSRLSAGGDWLVNAVRNNPEGLLLVGAGAALLLRRAGVIGARSDTGRDEYDWDIGGEAGGAGSEGEFSSRQRPESARPHAVETARHYADTARQYAAEARRYATDMGGRVAETAGSYLSSASDAGRAAMEQSSRFVSEAQSAVSHAQSSLQETGGRLLQDQPLLVAVAGLAAGAAVATAFPRTEIEERTLGPAGEQLTEMASQTAQQIKAAGLKAGEQLMSSAQQRGLDADGFKQMAHEAADAFGSALSRTHDRGSESARHGPEPDGSPSRDDKREPQ